MDLNLVTEIKRQIKWEKIQLEDLREVSKSVSIPKWDGMPKAKSLESSVERVVLKIIETEKRLEELKIELSEAKIKLTEEIYSRVKDSEAAAILVARYVHGLQFKAIAAKFYYSEGNIFYRWRKGKKSFEGTVQMKKKVTEKTLTKINEGGFFQ